MAGTRTKPIIALLFEAALPLLLIWDGTRNVIDLDVLNAHTDASRLRTTS
jgi:hypothetical protein